MLLCMPHCLYRICKQWKVCYVLCAAHTETDSHPAQSTYHINVDEVRDRIEANTHTTLWCFPANPLHILSNFQFKFETKLYIGFCWNWIIVTLAGLATNKNTHSIRLYFKAVYNTLTSKRQMRSNFEWKITQTILQYIYSGSRYMCRLNPFTFCLCIVHRDYYLYCLYVRALFLSPLQHSPCSPRILYFIVQCLCVCGCITYDLA